MKTIRIFLSSPGDVLEEREVALGVIRRLQGWFAGRVALVPVLWEQQPLCATSPFQTQIGSTAATDIAVFIFWSRLGTPLPEAYARDDGSRPTGTELEFDEALRSHSETGSPTLLVYRKTARALLDILSSDEVLRDAVHQSRALSDFFDQRFKSAGDGAFSAAFHSFPTASAFGERLEEHLVRLIEERLAGAGAPTSPPSWHGCPFCGLEAYELKQSPIFFGRTRAIHEVRFALRQQATDGHPFVLILGASGSGKSSLVRAGVLPLLTSPRAIEENIGEGLCRHAVMRAGDGRDPFEGLAAALLADSALGGHAGEFDAAERVSELLRSPEAAVAFLERELARIGRDAAERGRNQVPLVVRLVLVVDQLEELFTRAIGSPEERSAFFRVIDALTRSGLVWVIATIRSDFYSRLAESPEIMALKQGNGQYDLEPPTPTEVGQIIRLPVQAAGLRFETDARSGQRLDERIEEEAANSPNSLPLLAFALSRLYEARREKDGLLTFAYYQAMGGVAGAISTRAEAVFLELPATVRAAFPKLVRALVDVGVGEEAAVTARRAPLDDLVREKDTRVLIKSLVDARLLVTDHASGRGAFVCVGHEALLRTWPRLQNAIAHDRVLIQARVGIREAAARWEAEGQTREFLLPRGKLLREGRALLESGDLSSLEAVFVRASMGRERRRKLVNRAVWVIALAVAVGIVPLLQLLREKAQRDSALESAVAARETARASRIAYTEHSESIRELRRQVERARRSAFEVYAEPSRRAEFAGKEIELREAEREAGVLVQRWQRALEEARSAEERWGGMRRETLEALIDYALCRWIESSEAKDPMREALFRKQLESLGYSTVALEGRRAIELSVSPADADVWLFRYESREDVRRAPPVVPRWVPVPMRADGRERARSDAWADDFYPGDPCLEVVAVAADSVASRAGMVVGDLVVGVSGSPCGEGLFVSEVESGGMADRAGVRELASLLSIDGMPVEGWYEWRGPRPQRRVTEGEPRHAIQISGCEAPLVGPLDEAHWGFQLAPPAALVNSIRHAPMALTCLRGGERRIVEVPGGVPSGITCEPTAYPIIRSDACRVGLNVGAGPTRLEGLRPGSYLLVAHKAGYEDQRVPFVVSRAQASALAVELHPDGWTPKGFVWIPEGVVQFGGDADAYQAGERVVERVAGFAMSRVEVTYGEWFEFLNDDWSCLGQGDRDRLTALIDSGKLLPRDPRRKSEEMYRRVDNRYEPVGEASNALCGVSWDDIQEYLRWRNAKGLGRGERWQYALPTEREWERAARGADDRPFPWGDRFDWSLCDGQRWKPVPSLNEDGRAELCDESPFGVADLAGSRWEWTCDERVPGARSYVIRGGSWNYGIVDLFRAASRNDDLPGAFYDRGGFRLVATRRD